MRRLLTIVGSTLVVAAGLFSLNASNAQAASCTALTNGSLCISSDPSGYQASYTKSAGTAVTVDFNLKCTNGLWFGDNGSFVISAGQTRTYVFAVGSRGSCVVALIQGSTTYYSPSLSR